jgi:hypothetical protein
MAGPPILGSVWRGVALGFLRGAHRWTTSDLAAWLVGPYRDATSHVPRDMTRDMTRGARAVDFTRVEAILRYAARGVLSTLRDLQAGAPPTFVEAAIRDGAVVRTTEGLFVPLDRARMRLEDRVLSLLAADHLLRPVDYERRMVVCARCDSVVFDAVARATGKCGAHRVSGFVEMHRGGHHGRLPLTG